MATLPKTPPNTRNFPDSRRIGQLADTAGLMEAQRWFARERTWINEQHLQLCRIPAPTFFEQKRAEWFRVQLESSGWNASIDRAGNVLATFGEDNGPRPFLVSAHLDTVFAPGRPEDVYFAPDGRLVGPGTSDNGSGLAALLVLAKLLDSRSDLHELASCLLIVANVGEEGEGNLSGMRYLCQHSQEVSAIEAFIILDGPSIDHVTAQALASRRYEVTFSGPGGHNWNDQGTPNPVHALSEVISSFIRAADNRAGADRRIPCAYNFSIIEGGTSINAIPSSARTKLDIRSEDPAVLDELSILLTGIVERSLEQGNRSVKTKRLTAKIRDLGARPGGRLPEDSFLLQTIQAVDAYLNIRSRVDCASTDANVPLSMGLPAISIGAGGQGGGAHTSGEWYQPDRRETGLRRVLLLLAALFDRKRSQSGADTSSF
ncbi:MAG: M20/M25/M40 family metallo-hydrolase [Acidobacteriota bacterium]|nr:M20/M25/M40 family metallo-hydrolase [Acidobacteriota bacterium]